MASETGRLVCTLRKLAGHSGYQCTLIRNPGLYTRLHPFIGHLLVGLDAARPRPGVMIPRIAWRTRCAYEWNSHVRAARDVGITDAEIARVTAGPAHLDWSDELLTLG